MLSYKFILQGNDHIPPAWKALYPGALKGGERKKDVTAAKDRWGDLTYLPLCWPLGIVGSPKY